jgi:hypothetical protein
MLFFFFCHPPGGEGNRNGVKGAVIAETQSSPLPPRRWKLPAQPGGVKVDRPEGGDPCTHGEGP